MNFLPLKGKLQFNPKYMEIGDKLAGFKFFQATELNAKVDARN